MSLYGRLFAAGYDRGLRAAERAGLTEMRATLLSAARGRTLELGAGTGLNLRHYPGDGVRVVLSEPVEPMARRLERRVREAHSSATIVRAAADRLPFPDGSFDSVVVTLVLCTVPDERAALAEIRRVLTAEGRLLLLEHVRSDDARLSRWQDRLQPLWGRVACGCHCNRDTLAELRAAGFAVDDVEHGELPSAPAFIRPLIIGCAQPATA